MTRLVAENIELKTGSHPAAITVCGDCSFKNGFLTGLIGANGAGKTTFLKALAGLKAPDRGQIILGDRSLSDFSPQQKAASIAYLPQNRRIQWPVKARDLISLGRLTYGRSLSRLDQQDRIAINHAIEVTEVSDLLDRSMASLSGGERARILLARALAVDASVLLADEPLAALDPGYAMQIMDVLLQEAGRGRIVIVALHDLTLAARYCDQLVLWNQGRIVAEGTPEDVLTEEALAGCYRIKAIKQNYEGHLLITPYARADF
ncbi:MAG: ABC transporter ATP-binding protein [Zymomonas mobilis]|uniref:Iron complex transport system ATP-binding protein n=1 Tax=Zymomonas mobilis TaxID=542 RepID=A0A542VZP3_ZYMMB|nr:ABC transporter ATP-binding protein [Zymomonas mobilis]TQL16763.1 iron complex transport system ATP-binding protein [Zymomonas mobilis]